MYIYVLYIYVFDIHLSWFIYIWYIYKKLSIYAYLYIFIYITYTWICVYIYRYQLYIYIYIILFIYHIYIYTPSICICIGTVFECSLIVFGWSSCKVLAGKLCPWGPSSILLGGGVSSQLKNLFKTTCLFFKSKGTWQQNPRYYHAIALVNSPQPNRISWIQQTARFSEMLLAPHCFVEDSTIVFVFL